MNRQIQFVRGFKSMTDRKLDTRNKIELGGLIIKAGLNQYPKSIILGILIEAKNAIAINNQLLDQYQVTGDLEFSNHTKLADIKT